MLLELLELLELFKFPLEDDDVIMLLPATVKFAKRAARVDVEALRELPNDDMDDVLFKESELELKDMF